MTFKIDRSPSLGKTASLKAPPAASPTKAVPAPQTQAQPPDIKDQNRVIAPNSWAFGSDVSFEQKMANKALGTAVEQLENKLQTLSQQDPKAFKAILKQALGAKTSPAELNRLLKQAQNGSFPLPAQIGFASEAEMGDAMGAYNPNGGGKIFLNPQLANQPDRLLAILLEEVGHHMDAQITGEDAPGDEGRIFAEGVQQQRPLKADALKHFRAHQDHGQLDVNGQTLDVEFNKLRQNLQDAQKKRRAKVPGLLREIRKESNPVKRARLMVKVAQYMDLLPIGNLGRMNNYLSKYVNNPATFDKNAQDKFNSWFKQAMKSHETVSKALDFTDGGVLQNINELVKLGDIPALQSMVASLKEQTLTLMDHSIEAGYNPNVAVASATFVNTAFEFLLPSNVMDLPGAGSMLVDGIKSSGKLMKAFNGVLNKEVKGMKVAEKIANGTYKVNYELITTLSQNELKAVVLIKMSELQVAKSKSAVAQLQNEMKKLLKAVPSREQDAIREFMLQTMLQTSASYGGGANLEDAFLGK